MKRIVKKALIFMILCAVCLGGCKKKTGKEQEVEYPKIVYVNNISYYGTDEICEMVPRKAPDGVIETFVPREISPDAPNSANFGEDGKSMEYMILEDHSLILHMGDNWYYFRENTDGMKEDGNQITPVYDGAKEGVSEDAASMEKYEAFLNGKEKVSTSRVDLNSYAYDGEGDEFDHSKLYSMEELLESFFADRLSCYENSYNEK